MQYLHRLFVNFFRRFRFRHFIFCIVIFVIIYIMMLLKRSRQEKGQKCWLDQKAVAAAVLSVYGYLLILYTLVLRPVYSSPRCQLALFWSYRKVLGGSVYLAYEIILNYFMLIPIGLLLTMLIKKGNRKKRVFLYTILSGLFISISIECLQFVLCRGLFEFDDILGNVSGTALGYGIYKIIVQKINRGVKNGYGTKDKA